MTQTGTKKKGSPDGLPFHFMVVAYNYLYATVDICLIRSRTLFE